MGDELFGCNSLYDQGFLSFIFSMWKFGYNKLFIESEPEIDNPLKVLVQ
jgi:hypothetical protein